MDLGTVKKNLDSRAYRTVEDFKNVNIPYSPFCIGWRWLTLTHNMMLLSWNYVALSSLVTCTCDSFVCINCISGQNMNSLLCTVYRINAQVLLTTGTVVLQTVPLMLWVRIRIRIGLLGLCSRIRRGSEIHTSYGIQERQKWRARKVDTKSDFLKGSLTLDFWKIFNFLLIKKKSIASSFKVFLTLMMLLSSQKIRVGSEIREPEKTYPGSSGSKKPRIRNTGRRMMGCNPGWGCCHTHALTTWQDPTKLN